MSTTGDPHLYSRSREIGRKYGRTSNSEKRARAMMATQFALPITWRRQDQSEISRIDTTTKYNAYFSISRRWQLPALPSRCCRPREWYSAKRKKSRIKLHYGAGKEKIARFSVLEHAAQGFIKSRKVSCCSVEMFLLE